jgi:uncharacterized protein DUF927
VELKEFLSLLVPPGTMVVARLVERIDQATNKPFKTFSHRTAKLYADASTAIEQMSAGKENVYFALASFKQGFHVNPKTNKKEIRVRSNVAALKALWFDIDFKGEYPDAKTAILAVRAFTQASALPPPSVLVGSGNGLHVYWPLEQSVPLDRWQKLADALKTAAVDVGFAHPELKPTSVDLGCTADACRVLRPPGTLNWKDPANPKEVKLLYTSGKTYRYEELEAALTPWMTARRSQPPSNVVGAADINDDLTGGLGSRQEAAPSSFETVMKNCGVAKHLAETHGKDCSEPEWVASLQLLKHCEDGAMWVHPISDGHAGYNAAATDKKWEQRVANSAGPTLCSTFQSHHPSICARCPHNGFIKTPIQLGHEDQKSLDGLPPGWRVAADKRGVERLMIMDVGEGKTEKEWVRVLRYIPMNLRATRSIVTQRYELTFDVEFQQSKAWAMHLPGSMLGNPRKLCEAMADMGVVLKEKETKSFIDLMATWLSQLQAARRVADVTEQLGWLIAEEKVVGFSCGPTTFYADGRTRNDVRAAREFSAVAKFYEPRGGLEPWKRVANFLADQNNPAFTAILSASFGSPLLKFTGLSGGVLSIVSTASGVGKSSVLKCSQSVWGSPTHGVNAVDDTPKSVARKLGFLNNLPAYWDELRGRKTIDDFVTLAFQITQGKEKTRLDSSATLREIQTWETLLIVASNESILEAMARNSGGTDAGVVRTYEMFLEPFASDRNRAEITLLFEQLHSNYGHAGRLYGAYLATHASEVEKRVQDMFKKLAAVGKMEAQERFWFAIMASLVVGAELATKLDLVKIDVRTLLQFLMSNLIRLRGRATESLSSMEPVELLASFMAAYQDRSLIVADFPKGKQNASTYLPEVLGVPRGDKVVYHVSNNQKLIRFPVAEITRWLEMRQLPSSTIMRKFKTDLGARELRFRVGVGTKWELPPQRCMEVVLSGNTAAAAMADDVLPPDRPADRPED